MLSFDRASFDPNVISKMIQYLSLLVPSVEALVLESQVFCFLPTGVQQTFAAS